MRRIALAAVVPLGAFLLAPAGALAQDGPTLEDTVSSLNTTWVIVAAVLVMFMQAGFAVPRDRLLAREERRRRGREDPDNFSIASLCYWAVGFALAFGGAGDDRG